MPSKQAVFLIRPPQVGGALSQGKAVTQAGDDLLYQLSFVHIEICSQTCRYECIPPVHFCLVQFLVKRVHVSLRKMQDGHTHPLSIVGNQGNSVLLKAAMISSEFAGVKSRRAC